MSHKPPIVDSLLLAIIPSTRSLLDWSGNARNPTIAGAAASLDWVRTNGIHSLRSTGTGRLVIPNDVELEAVTDFSLFFSGSPGGLAVTRRLFNKRGLGGTHLDVYLDTGTDVEMYDGVILRTASIGSWVGVKNFAVVQESGTIGDLYANGAWKSAFSGVTTITGNSEDVTLLNYYDGANPCYDGYRALLFYSRVLTANEISTLATWSDALSSPTITPNRKYFSQGGWVANGPQPSYGESGDNLVVDSDMEAVGTAAWSTLNGAILTKESGSPSGSGTQVLRVAYNIAANPIAYQAIVTVGQRYRLRGWARGDGVVTAPRIRCGGGMADWNGTTSTAWQVFDITAMATGGTGVWLHALGTGWAEFDNVTVEQTNNLLSDGDMEDGTVGEWTPINNAVLTKETGTPYQGAQVLRVAYNGINDPFARQSGVFVLGKKYRVTGVARSDGIGVPYVYVGGAAATFVGTNSTLWQPFDLTVLADGTFFYLQSVIAGAGYCEFDQVLIREVFETVGAWDLGAIHSNSVADKS